MTIYDSNSKSFKEEYLQKYADVILWGLKTSRKKTLEKKDIILINFDLLGIRLAEIIEAKLLDKATNPIKRINPTPTMEQNFFNKSNHQQITFKTPGDSILYKNLDGAIFIRAPESITHLNSVDPQKISKFALSKKYLKNILDKREQSGLFGWTLCMLPTIELAKHAGVKIETYTNQIIKSCFLDQKNPLEKWEEIYNRAKSLKKWLNTIQAKYFHIESENIDLIITPGEQRKWVGISGHNIPSFELFISPDWRGTNGFYYANQPSYRNGNYIDKIKLSFKNGIATKVQATTGEAFLKNQLSIDKGASRLGEFSLTDKRFSKINHFMANTLFDENYGGEFGNCHIAVGSSYYDTYNQKNKPLSQKTKIKLGFNDSAIHWDLINTEKKRITAHLFSGKKISIYENGKFLF